MLHEELLKQHGMKYTLVLTAELEKVSVSVGQVYDDSEHKCMTTVNNQI